VSEDVRPVCALCGREVDELEWWYDRIGRGWVFLARCHGQKERAFVRDVSGGEMREPPRVGPDVAFPAGSWVTAGHR
jgi:hypothetical protein